MTIRTATPDDLAGIMRLERASFRGDAWSETVMRDELASPHTHYVVVDRGGVRGYAGLRSLPGAKDADVQTIALAESDRGRGEGRMLLRTLLAEAAARGNRDVFLDVREDNDVARRLYESEGFVAIGRRENYYPDGGMAAVVMRLDVRGWAAARSEGAGSGDASAAGACT